MDIIEFLRKEFLSNKKCTDELILIGEIYGGLRERGYISISIVLYLRLSGQFQASLFFFLRKNFERKKTLTSKNQLTKQK